MAVLKAAGLVVLKEAGLFVLKEAELILLKEAVLARVLLVEADENWVAAAYVCLTLTIRTAD